MSEEQKAPKEPKEKKRGVGDAAIEALKAGKSNEEALAAVKAEFPDSKTSLASINWYRNALRADGVDIPTSRDLKKAAKAASAGEPAKAEGF